MSSRTETIRRGRRCARSAALAVALLFPLVSGAAHALEIVLGVGEYDVEEDQGDGPVEVDLVFRLTGTEIWRSQKHGMVLVPAFGAMATEDETCYGWGGFALVIPLGAHWGLVPEVGAGYYERGDGKNLGGDIEFRSGLEVTYRPSDALRVGVGFYHLSNAGIYEVNPGVNSLLLTFGFKPRSHARVWDTAGLH